MLSKTITYVDFNGDKREETFMFNISRAEMVRMETSINGGLRAFLKLIIAENDTPKIMEYFEKFIRESIGRKSLDGKRFEKSEEIANEFFQSEAWSELLMELINVPNAASDFVNATLGQVDSDKPTDIPQING